MEKYWIKKDNWELQTEKTTYQHNPDYNIKNLMKLTYTHTPEILHHLNYRFNNNNIYTNAGKILIATNPFKQTQLYSKEEQEKYLKNNYTNEPHIYQTVNEAILSGEYKQSFLISGESGSGKTETTKRILEYLALHYKDKNNILPKILEFNGLLEAFGNASTIRNHNSSRFGKYINIDINNTISARLQTYLLEKVRLVGKNLSNYHIFYSFGYEKNYTEYKRDDWDTTYLKKCNLKKVWLENNLSEKYWDDLENIINYLIDILNDNYDEKMILLMKEKTIKTGGEVIKVSLEEKESINVKDTVVMVIYERLFEKVVELINRQISGDEIGKLNYGILDIFGFEVFEENMFEQLCINYTNERLQALFNRFVFEEEIKMFEEEGILKNRVSFENNTHILDFFDKKPYGFFPLLDEKSIVGAKDVDLELSLPNDKKVIHKKRDCFVIHHYADDVEYIWGDFSNKNIEKYNQDIQHFLQEFYKSFSIFEDTERKIIKKKRGSISISTITSKFRSDLTKLIDELSNSHLHFVRCIKPNDENIEGKWDEGKIEAQLNYCGIISALELARQTFPIRMKKDMFKKKYECLLDDGYSVEELDGENFLNGKTMVFYTADMQKFFNEKLIEIQKRLLEKLVCIIKMKKNQKTYRELLIKSMKIQSNIRCYKSKKELKRRMAVLKLQINWRTKIAKNIYNKRLTSCKKIQRFLKLKYKEQVARKIIERFCKMNIERKKYVGFIIEERQNIENIIKQSIDNEKLKMELHYEQIINDLNNKIKEQENQIEKLDTNKNDYLQLLSFIDKTKLESYEEDVETVNSEESTEDRTEEDIKENTKVDKSVEVNFTDEQLIEEYKNQIEFEKSRYTEVQALYDGVQSNFYKYKMEIKEAQIQLGEKMLRLYNENMALKEENMGLLREVKKLQQKKWYDKLIG